jgi:hypothetical protein
MSPDSTDGIAAMTVEVFAARQRCAHEGREIHQSNFVENVQVVQRHAPFKTFEKIERRELSHLSECEPATYFKWMSSRNLRSLAGDIGEVGVKAVQCGHLQADGAYALPGR